MVDDHRFNPFNYSPASNAEEIIKSFGQVALDAIVSHAWENVLPPEYRQILMAVSDPGIREKEKKEPPREIQPPHTKEDPDLIEMEEKDGVWFPKKMN